ncbi:hypothetical protein CHH79_07550 [Bacillus siamensis]|nr:hypothetical protein CHH79_07550 [Bacillus siamensis]PIK29193.1 hypothetical protein CS954_19705 [Bacillus siamensis]
MIPLAGILFAPNPVKNARYGHSFFMLSKHLLKVTDVKTTKNKESEQKTCSQAGGSTSLPAL